MLRVENDEMKILWVYIILSVCVLVFFMLKVFFYRDFRGWVLAFLWLRVGCGGFYV